MPHAGTVAFSPDGGRLSIGGEFGLVVRAIPGGEITRVLDWRQAAPNYNDAAFSLDGRRLAAAYSDGTVWLWCHR